MSVRLSSRVGGLQKTLIRRLFDAAPADAINLGLGQPDLPTPELVAQAGIHAIEKGQTGYTTTAGDLELRRRIAARYPGFGGSPENVVVTVGSQEALFAALMVLVDVGDEVLFPDPGYPAYATAVGLLGAHPVAYALHDDEGFLPTVEELQRKVSGRTRVAILCSPSNPTGAVIDETRTRELVGSLEERGIAWIADEVYASFVYDAPFVSPSALGQGGVVVTSLSKSVSMTGWRLGWSVADAPTSAKIAAAHQHLATCAPTISQHAAIAALSPEGRAIEESYRVIFAQRREEMAAALAAIPDIRFRKPGGAFYYFVDVSARGSSLELAQQLAQDFGVVVIPGEAFGERGTGYLRISFAATSAAIREGVGRLGRLLA